MINHNSDAHRKKLFAAFQDCYDTSSSDPALKREKAYCEIVSLLQNGLNLNRELDTPFVVTIDKIDTQPCPVAHQGEKTTIRSILTADKQLDRAYISGRENLLKDLKQLFAGYPKEQTGKTRHLINNALRTQKSLQFWNVEQAKVLAALVSLETVRVYIPSYRYQAVVRSLKHTKGSLDHQIASELAKGKV